MTDICIPKRVKIAEAPSRGQSIFGYAPQSASARDFAQLAQELETRLRIRAAGTISDENPSASDRLGTAAG